MIEMFNNPYFNGFRESNGQQPINNIFTTQLPQNDLFMAKFLNNGEVAENQFITTKTAFIDLNNKQLKIRDPQGQTTTYGLILPMDAKDEKIMTLEKEIMQLKEMIRNESNANVSTNNESTQSNGDGAKSNRTKSSS